ncbi:MAG: DNRLRE domain-containing protein, partial [Gemmatimonadetes bacterium]|nr:DNRLRE domain-containing protein [Gemmatimonadota bacterium]
MVGLILSAASAWSDPYTFTSPLSWENTDDTFLSEKFPNTNYADADSLKSGGNAKRNRALIKYTTPIIPGGGTIASAILHIPIRDYKGSVLEKTRYAIHRMTGDWDADHATWTMADSAKAWTQNGGDYDTTTIATFVVDNSDTMAVVDLTSLVAGWVTSPSTNKGMMIRATSEPGVIVIDPDIFGRSNAVVVHKATVFESSDQTEQSAGAPYFVITIHPPEDVLPPVVSAIGEISPHLLPRGGPVSFDLLVRVSIRGPGYDTGFDRVTLPLSAGLENVTHVKSTFEGVDLNPVVSGSSTSLVLDLAPPIDSSGVLQISFTMEAPGADTAETFSVPPTLDDTNTLFGPMTPSPGDVDGSNNGNHMRVTVPGVLSTIAITPALDSIPADTTITFTATGYDNDSNEVPVNALWSATTLIGLMDPVSGFFDPIRVSEGYVTATDGAVAGSLYTHVIPGKPIGFAIAPPDTTVSMDETVDFVSIAIDGDFNWYRPKTTWSVMNPGLAAIDTSGLLTPAAPGSTFVIGSYDGWYDTSAVAITPGEIAAIDIDPASATITSLQQIQFQATARDAYGNEVADPGTYTWAGGALIGTIDPVTGLFDATTAGKDVIRVSYKKPNVITPEGEVALGATIVGLTDTITVIPGPAVSAAIAPSSTSLGIGGAVQFTYQAFDAEGNAAAETPSWTVTGDIGTISGAGLLTATSPGNGLAIVTVGSVSDTASVEVLDNEGLVIEAVLESRDRVTQGESGLPVGIALRNESGNGIASFSFDLTFEGPLGQPLNAEYVVDSILAPFDTLASGTA